ncbi:MAG: hypothetical protein RL684_1140 [Pseudomonadota bacterium]|jgi:hypothetical protein
MGAIAATGSSASAYPSPLRANGGSRTSLDAEVAQCQRRLADLVTCPSSKTPEGKAAMQALSDKITAARAQIQQAPSAAAPGPGPGRVDTWA